MVGRRVGLPMVVLAAILGALAGATVTWAALTMGGLAAGVEAQGDAGESARPSPATSGAAGAGPGGGGSGAGGPGSTADAAPGRTSAATAATALQLDIRYDFDVTIDYASSTVHVVERLTVTNAHGPVVDRVNLFVLPHQDAEGFRELVLGSVRVDGVLRPVRWTRDGVNLLVRLPRWLSRSATTELRIEFDLHPGPDVRTGQAAALSKSRGIMQLLLWYPIPSDGHGAPLDGDPSSALPASPVTYRIRSTEPLDMAVPGVLEHIARTQVRGRLEHARDFAFAVSPDFRTWTGQSGATTVTVHARRGASGATARDIVVDALDDDGELLDLPYPAARLVVVGGNMDMESSGIVFVKRDGLEDQYDLGHEVAHQWFHWVVGNDQLLEPWLDEAFATYLGGGLAPRHEDGFCSAAPVNSTVYRFPNVPLDDSWRNCGSYVQTVYYKGSWMLDAIRRTIGDAAFSAALREYVATFRFEVATAADLLRILRRHAPSLTDADLAPWLVLDDGSLDRRHASVN